MEALIARGADAAVAKLGPGIGRDLEKRRLQRLLKEWLEIEKSRPEFIVAGIEAERVASNFRRRSQACAPIEWMKSPAAGRSFSITRLGGN